MFGYGIYVQLVLGDIQDRTKPTLLMKGEDIKAIARGCRSMILKSDGQLLVFGYNRSSQVRAVQYFIETIIDDFQTFCF